MSASFRAIRLANRIIGDEDGWGWENCKVRFGASETAGLASVIERVMEGRTEADIIEAWGKAVVEAHGAVVDGLAAMPLAYAIGCFKRRLSV